LSSHSHEPQLFGLSCREIFVVQQLLVLPFTIVIAGKQECCGMEDRDVAHGCRKIKI